MLMLMKNVKIQGEMKESLLFVVWGPEAM